MKKRSKKEIKEALDKLKAKPQGAPGYQPQQHPGKLSSKKSSQRIRKQGV